MTGKTHRIIGITAGLGYFLVTTPSVYQPATLGAVIIASYIGSLIADADDASADIWDSVPMGHTVGKFTDPLLGHRNVSHSIVGVALYAVALYAISQIIPPYWGIDSTIVIVSSIIAYCSHLIADSFTVEGIPLFWPYKYKIGIPPKPLQGIRIQTGEWFENLIVFTIANLALIALIIANWQKIQSIILK